ncbi:MAG TPA: hypothetical protein VFG69_04405, partial [Nannocystaceae bacterium]|nr:hypothetical protein [Nannocystaceae bacterium]
MLVGLASARARAAEYEVFVDVGDEDELYELYITDQISEATYLTLLDVMRRGTDLATATRDDLYALPNLTYADVDRILEYRKEAGTIVDPATLVAAGAITRRKLLALAPFLVIEEALRRPPVNGFARYQGVWTVGDKRVPTMMLQARINAVRHLTAGFGGRLTRDRIGRVSWDPNRQALSASGPKPRVDLPKVFIQWDTPEYGVIAGSYRIGFGQRLTFDNSGRYTPNGFYFDDSLYYRAKPTGSCRLSLGERDSVDCDDVQSAPDYKFRYGLLGVAAGAKHIALPVGWLQIYGFASYQPRQIYQYQVLDRNRCPDPSDDENPDCDAPDVYARRDPLLAPSNQISFSTLPNVFALALGGGNFTWFHDRRTRVGVTGYGAAPRWLVGGTDLDFQNWSPFPYGGAFGAIGADASWGHRWADLFAEVTRSFDSQKDGDNGGYAGLLRHTATFDNHELEVSGRWYDKEFQNPFARPIAAIDQNDGLRATDEAGGRIRYNAYLAKRVDLRTFFDVWTGTAQPRPQIKTYARVDVDATKWLRPGVRFDLQDRDLRTGAHGECFYSFQSSGGELDANGAEVPEDSDDLDDAGRPATCTGARYAATGYLRFQPIKRLWFRLQYMHEFIDDTNYPNGVREDATGVFTLAARPIDALG